MGEQNALYPGPGMISDYHDWFDGAKHGDVLIYHVGDLQYDRQGIYDEHNPEEKTMWAKVITLNAVADSISYECRRGYLCLTQRRMAENTFEYRATRLKPDTIRREQAIQQSDNDKRVRV